MKNPFIFLKSCVKKCIKNITFYNYASIQREDNNTIFFEYENKKYQLYPRNTVIHCLVKGENKPIKCYLMAITHKSLLPQYFCGVLIGNKEHSFVCFKEDSTQIDISTIEKFKPTYSKWNSFIKTNTINLSHQKSLGT